MSTLILNKLSILTNLKMPPAAGVMDALELTEQAIPETLGSMLIWASESGEVTGGFSNLQGVQEALAVYATEFANSSAEETVAELTFQDSIKSRLRAHRLEEILQVSNEAFHESDIYRELFEPCAVGDLARCTITADDRPIGALFVFRKQNSPTFTKAELAKLDHCSELIGRVLQCRASAGIPVVDESVPGMAEMDPDGNLARATRTFHLHLAMQNQPVPGQGPANFQFRVPAEVIEAAKSLGTQPDKLMTDSVWGQFRVTLERFMGSANVGLTSHRCIPTGLMMFRRIADYALSLRQRQVACALAEGDSFNDMAERWQISRNSVITHANFLYDKLGISGKTELMSQFIWDRR